MSATMFLAVALAAGSAESSDQAQPPNLSARVHENPTRCRFDSLPALTLYRIGSNYTGQFFRDSTARTEGNFFRVTFSPRPTGYRNAPWDGNFIDLDIRLDSAALRSNPAKRVTIAVDGQDIDIPLRVEDGRPGVWPRPVKREDDSALAEAIARGSTVVVRMFDDRGTLLGEGTFDVGGLRHAAAALRAANWSCDGARTP
jgi:hypothetical protein